MYLCAPPLSPSLITVVPAYSSPFQQAAATRADTYSSIVRLHDEVLSMTRILWWFEMEFRLELAFLGLVPVLHPTQGRIYINLFSASRLTKKA